MARLTTFLKWVTPNASKPPKIVQKIAGLIPRTGPLDRHVTNRFIVAGDAGGFTNSIFYGGIIIGIHTGIVAAETIAKAHMAGQGFSESALHEFEERVGEMPYTNPIIQEGHNLFYNELEHADIKEIGRILDRMEITQIPFLQNMIIILRALRQPRMRRKVGLGQRIAKAFRISQDWGF